MIPHTLTNVTHIFTNGWQYITSLLDYNGEACLRAYHALFTFDPSRMREGFYFCWHGNHMTLFVCEYECVSVHVSDVALASGLDSIVTRQWQWRLQRLHRFCSLCPFLLAALTEGVWASCRAELELEMEMEMRLWHARMLYCLLLSLPSK